MELFAEFELDDVEKKEELRWITPVEYRAEEHCDGWFMREEQHPLVDKRELLSQRASYLNRLGRHQEALEILLHLKAAYPHKGSFLFMAEDACLSTALMIPSFPVDRLMAMLDSLRPTVMNYGDQLQYFSLCAKVYSLSSKWPLFLRSLILLSSYLDMPEQWQQMARLPEELHGPHFSLGCLIKADLLIDFQLRMSRGFVTRRLEGDQKRVRERIREEQHADKISTARREMDTTIVKGGGGEKNDDLARPAHLCRWTEGSLLTLSSSLAVIDSFLSTYSWMLEGMDEICMQMREVKQL